MNNYDALENEVIQDIIKYQNDLGQLLTIVNQVAKDKYDLGFEDGYDNGEHVGWCDCYDMMSEDYDMMDEADD